MPPTHLSRHRWIAAIAIVVTSCIVNPAGPRAQHSGSVAEVAKRAAVSVVHIATISEPESTTGEESESSPFDQFFDGLFADAAKPSGSGFIVDAAGYIVTNNNKIVGAARIYVQATDGKTRETRRARVIGRDAKSDITVLKIEPELTLTAIGFGDSGASVVGDTVVAIGDGSGGGALSTTGILSAIGDDGPSALYLQTDAFIADKLGGPLLNENGEVIGISTAIVKAGDGDFAAGFVIPSSIAKPIVEQIIHSGEVRRSWIGVRIENVTDDKAQSLGMDRTTGALVADITDDGPADISGLKKGDIILQFDDVGIDSACDVSLAVASTPIGEEVPVRLYRNGREITLYIRPTDVDRGE